MASHPVRRRPVLAPFGVLWPENRDFRPETRPSKAGFHFLGGGGVMVRARVACAQGGGSAVAVPIQVVSPTSPPALSKVLQARGAPPNALRDASGVLWLRGCPLDPPPPATPLRGPIAGARRVFQLLRPRRRTRSIYGMADREAAHVPCVVPLVPCVVPLVPCVVPLVPQCTASTMALERSPPVSTTPPPLPRSTASTPCGPCGVRTNWDP